MIIWKQLQLPVIIYDTIYFRCYMASVSLF